VYRCPAVSAQVQEADRIAWLGRLDSKPGHLYCRPTTDEVIAVLQDLVTSKSSVAITEGDDADGKTENAVAAASPPVILPQAVRAALGDDCDVYLASHKWQPVMRQAATVSSEAHSVISLLASVRLTNVFTLPPPPGVYSDTLWDTGGGASQVEPSKKRLSKKGSDGAGQKIPRKLQSTVDAEYARPTREESCSVTSAEESDDFHDAMEELKSDESLFRYAFAECFFVYCQKVGQD
jgi:hypothetical protein